MGVISLAPIANGTLRGGPDFDVPTWVVISCASAIALGTYTGGWRIIETLGTKVVSGAVAGSGVGRPGAEVNWLVVRNIVAGWLLTLPAAAATAAVAYAIIDLFGDGERGPSALELAGIADRFDLVLGGDRSATTLLQALERIDAVPEAAVFADVTAPGIAAARTAGFALTIAIARGTATPEALRQAGASVVVADLQELLGPT